VPLTLTIGVQNKHHAFWGTQQCITSYFPVHTTWWL
jgi:hypothetical protein